MKIAIFGGSPSFSELLRIISDGNLKSYSSVGEALVGARKIAADVLFILPEYSAGKRILPEFSDAEAELIASLSEEGKTKLFIENYPAFDYRDCFLLGLQPRGYESNIGRLSLCLTEKYSKRLGFEILVFRSGYYLPSAPHTHEKTEIILEIKNCIGVHKALMAEERTGVVLMRTGDSVYCSMADITNIKSNRIFSYCHWRDFYSFLLSMLTGCREEKVLDAFLLVYERVMPRRELRSKNMKEALEESVSEAIGWHLNSGILKDGGQSGVYEMVRSLDLEIAKNVRADSGLYTAALFMAAGKYFGKPEYENISDAIAQNLLSERGVQITEGKNKGLFKWFAGVGGSGPRSVYASDCSRVGQMLLALYRLTGREEYKRRSVMLGDALLGWFGGEALLPGAYLCYDREDIQTVQNKARRLSVEFYDAPMLFLGNLYAVTDDGRYKDQILNCAARLAEAYPNFETATSHSDNFTYSRLLGVLSVAQSFGNGIWTPVLDRIIGYFSDLQHPSGGIADGEAYISKDSLGTDVEFAVGLGGRDGVICDLVYCQNSVLYSLNYLISHGVGDYDRKTAKDVYYKLVNFLLDVQIRSSDQRLNGAWMRAFDMENYEYYGCDKDFAWGPYCILTGWVTGSVPLVFLDLLGVKTVY